MSTADPALIAPASTLWPALLPAPALSTAPPPAPTLGAGLLAAALVLPLGGPAQAESAPERGLVAFKYLDYLDSQPGRDRVRVRAPSALLLMPLSSDWSIGGKVISDAISGASPAYHTSGLSRLKDERRALEGELTRYLPHGSVSVGASVSSEQDYLSRGVSLQATRSSDDKNTTWTAGLGFNSDVVHPSNRVVDHQPKRVSALQVGVTQVLGVHDIAQLSLGVTRGRGYFSDPYKIFDQRPRQRDQATVLARWNHHADSTDTTLRWSYRYYSDSWRIRAHTLSLEAVQPLAQGWTITPSLRLYTQGAARFYLDAEARPGPFPPNPPDDAVFFSQDQRVSAFGARTVGLKVAKKLGEDWTVDLKVERYAQRGAWRLFGAGSPNLAPFHARSVQVGLAHEF